MLDKVMGMTEVLIGYFEGKHVIVGSNYLAAQAAAPAKEVSRSDRLRGEYGNSLWHRRLAGCHQR
jgi:hypothetical protein